MAHRSGVIDEKPHPRRASSSELERVGSAMLAMPPDRSETSPFGRFLSFSEREEIAILWARKSGESRAIARELGRSASTICRELRRNSSTRAMRGPIRATTPQWHAERRARRPKCQARRNGTCVVCQEPLFWADFTRPKSVMSCRVLLTSWIAASMVVRQDRLWATPLGARADLNRLPYRIFLVMMRRCGSLHEADLIRLSMFRAVER